MAAFARSDVMDSVRPEGDEVGLAERNRIRRFGRRLRTGTGERPEQAGGGACDREGFVHEREFGIWLERSRVNTAQGEKSTVRLRRRMRLRMGRGNLATPTSHFARGTDRRSAGFRRL